MLHEGAAYTFDDRCVPVPRAAEWEDAILRAQQHLHALGITGWQDAWVTPETLEAYRSLGRGRPADRAGRRRAVVGPAPRPGADRRLLQRERRAQRARSASGFHPTTVKIMTDGVLENYTGALLEPYCDGCGGHDRQPRPVLRRPRAARAPRSPSWTALGFQVHLHAIGDRAVRNALDAVEAARAATARTRPAAPHRPRPGGAARGHAAVRRARRGRELPGLLGADRAADGRADPAVPRPRARRLQYPFEALRRAGARLRMGSDWAVTTANPFEQLEVAVTRVDPEHRDNAPFLPERAALARRRARRVHGRVGVRQPRRRRRPDRGGRRADLAVLDLDVIADGTGPGDIRMPGWS